MAKAGNDVRSEIEETKGRMDDRLGELEDRLQGARESASNAMSLQHHMHQRPWLIMAGAVGVGFLLGRRRPERHVVRALPSRREERASRKERAAEQRAEQRAEKRAEKAESNGGEADQVIGVAKSMIMKNILPAVLGATARNVTTMVMPSGGSSNEESTGPEAAPASPSNGSSGHAAPPVGS